MPETKNDFDVAKSLFDQLDGLDKERQHRVLRWVAESLGIALHVKTPGTPATNEPASFHPGATDTPLTPQSLGSRSTDIKSFVTAKNPKSDVQYAAVVAYYYRFEAPAEERKETITSEILQESTRLAGRTRLTKPVMTLNNSKNLGYLDPAGRGSFKINTVGENLVAMTLPGTQGRQGDDPPSGNGRTKKG